MCVMFLVVIRQSGFAELRPFRKHSEMQKIGFGTINRHRKYSIVLKQPISNPSTSACHCWTLLRHRNWVYKSRIFTNDIVCPMTSVFTSIILPKKALFWFFQWLSWVGVALILMSISPEHCWLWALRRRWRFFFFKIVRKWVLKSSYNS